MMRVLGLLLLLAAGAESFGKYSESFFPASVNMPRVDSDLNMSLEGTEYLKLPVDMGDDPSRALPVNYSRARFYAAPWAFAGPKLPASGPRRLRSSICSMTTKPNVSRRTALGFASVVLADVLLPKQAQSAGLLPSTTLKDMEKAAAEEKARKLANAPPPRPRELRDQESCYMWNGKKECFSCVKQCERWKKLSPNLDCNEYCTVEYGAPKPTDEDSISFRAFVELVYKGEVTKVDFYGSNGDKAYAATKDAKPIRIGEGFPVEIGNEASSPLQVVRLLKQNNVPYQFHFLDGIKYNKIGNARI